MLKFVKKDDGLVTIEWVGIAAVMVLAAIAVTAFVMQGTSETGQAVRANIDGAAADITPATGIPFTPPTTP
jgi:hypothetical protein